MTIEQTLIFFENLESDKINKLLDQYQNNIFSTEKYILTITKWIAILVFLYYLLSNKGLKGIIVMGLDISELNLIEKILPLIISCLILFYVMAAIHKGQSIKFYNILFNKYYADGKRIDGDLLFHAKNLMPLGILNSLQINNKGCLIQLTSWLSTIPFLCFQLLPYVFMYQSLYKIYHNYLDDNFMKIIFVFTAWITVLSAFKFFMFVFNTTNEINDVTKKYHI